MLGADKCSCIYESQVAAILPVNALLHLRMRRTEVRTAWMDMDVRIQMGDNSPFLLF